MFHVKQTDGAMAKTNDMNEYGQPVGWDVPDWKPSKRPERTTISGRSCRLEALDAARHVDDLFAANSLGSDGRNWTYMSYGPFDGIEAYRNWVIKVTAQTDPIYYAIIDLESGRAVGVAALMRIDSANGSIEVGNIAYSPLLQRKAAATEAMFLLMSYVFDTLGYRRYEWKCDSLNEPSRHAAYRLGFTYEGLFRQAVIYKGRNRDTAWFSIVDREWPGIKTAFEEWLKPENFDSAGVQKTYLRDLIIQHRSVVR